MHYYEKDKGTLYSVWYAVKKEQYFFTYATKQAYVDVFVMYFKLNANN